MNYPNFLLVSKATDREAVRLAAIVGRAAITPQSFASRATLNY